MSVLDTLGLILVIACSRHMHLRTLANGRTHVPDLPQLP